MIKVNVTKPGQALFDGVGLFLSNWEFHCDQEPKSREELLAASLIAVLDYIRAQIAIPGFSMTDTAEMTPEASLDVQRMAQEFITKAKVSDVPRNRP